ncbi:MAG: HD domain-containing protein [Chitinivibrionales bacterium]|nr:HD domain-containing protein [Chitinivibrionales bacterium]
MGTTTKKISLESIEPGAVATQEYLSEKGELLIAKGMVITERHLDILRRRNIFEVFLKLSSEEEELQHIISRQFDAVDDFELEPEKQTEAPPPEKSPVVSNIKEGRIGLEQLKKSEITFNLDKRIKSQGTADRPFGRALADKATQISVAERTEEYKERVANQYEEALSETTELLNRCAQGGDVNAQEVRSTVSRFVKLFVTDKNILLNISGIKHKGKDYLYSHSLNVCLLSVNIAAACGYNEFQVMEIGMGAILHDVGMLLLPEKIRIQEKKLTEDEWFEVQKHPILGLHLMEKIKGLPESVPIISYQSHERVNARGYPKQRGTRLIHRFAKLVQVADVYEAMSSPRSYRRPLIPYKAMENIIKMTKRNLVSSEYTKAFLQYASLFPVGSLVQLNDDRIAKVIDTNKDSFAKPVVSVLTDKSGTPYSKEKITQIDLHKDSSVQIVKALPNDCMNAVGIMDGF